MKLCWFCGPVVLFESLKLERLMSSMDGFRELCCDRYSVSVSLSEGHDWKSSSLHVLSSPNSISSSIRTQANFFPDRLKLSHLMNSSLICSQLLITFWSKAFWYLPVGKWYWMERRSPRGNFLSKRRIWTVLCRVAHCALESSGKSYLVALLRLTPKPKCPVYSL